MYWIIIAYYTFKPVQMKKIQCTWANKHLATDVFMLQEPYRLCVLYVMLVFTVNNQCHVVIPIVLPSQEKNTSVPANAPK